MPKINTGYYIFVFLILFSAFFSCGRVPKDVVPELYWPLPPEKPRIKFVDLVIGSIDATGVRTGKFTHLLFGEEPEFGFSKPSFVAAKGSELYVTDVGSFHVFDFENKKYLLIGMGVLRNPTGIDVSEDGRIFVGDSARAQVLVFNKKGENKYIIGSGKFGSVGGLAVDEKNGRLIVCDTKRHTVLVFDLGGELLFTIGKGGTQPGEFNYPYSVAVDKDGRMYVMDSGNFRVQVFGEDGSVISAFGSVGVTPGSFSRPKGIAVDSEKHIYVVDSAYGNFQIFDIYGRVYLSVGESGFLPGQFLLPLGIYIDKQDKIYVVDQLNRRVQVFQYLKQNG